MPEQKQPHGYCADCGAAVSDDLYWGRGYTEQNRRSKFGLQEYAAVCECCDPEAAREKIRELAAELRELRKGA